MERKTFGQAFAFKALSEEGAFEGMGSVFGTIDTDNDIVERGAFARSIAERGIGRIKLLWQHDFRKPIGKLVEIREQERGLFVRGKLTLGVQQASEARALMLDGALDGLSIGFRTKRAEVDPKSRVRHIKDVDLLEISLVTLPANEQAVVQSVKQIKTIREFEHFLRDEGGFSNAQAKRLAASGFKTATLHRDDAALADMQARLARLRDLLTT